MDFELDNETDFASFPLPRFVIFWFDELLQSINEKLFVSKLLYILVDEWLIKSLWMNIFER